MGLRQDLEAVADAQHNATVAGEIRYLPHDRAEAGYGPRAQVISVEEPTRQDYAVRIRQVMVLVPEIEGFHLREGAQRVSGVILAVRAREDDYPEPHSARPAHSASPPASVPVTVGVTSSKS